MLSVVYFYFISLTYNQRGRNNYYKAQSVYVQSLASMGFYPNPGLGAYIPYLDRLKMAARRATEVAAAHADTVANTAGG